jgi:hypothetical protein
MAAARQSGEEDLLLQRRVGRPRFVRLRMKIPPGLTSKPVTTAPVGVTSLFGGVTEEC